MHVKLLVVASLAALAAMAALSCMREPQATPTPQGASAGQSTATALPATTPTPDLVIAAAFLLVLQTPAEEEVVVVQPTVEVRGKTVLDAVVTINGEVVPVDASGEFSANVELEPGPNTVTVVANDFQGNEQARVLTVIYVP